VKAKIGGARKRPVKRALQKNPKITRRKPAFDPIRSVGAAIRRHAASGPNTLSDAMAGSDAFKKARGQ
jgi:hypothetical protein